MPATIVVVLDDQAAREAAERALRVAGLDVATFTDSIIALEAIEKSGKTRIVVCPVTSGRGTLTGVALLRMLRRRQLISTGKSSIRAVLIGQPEDREYVEKVDEFLHAPFDPQGLVAAVQRLLQPGRATPLRITGGPIIWEGPSPARTRSVHAAPVRFSPRTDQLLREARWTIQRAAAVQQWRMSLRQPFETRPPVRPG